MRVARATPEPPPLRPPRRERKRKPRRDRSETLARIAWAVPWIAIVVTIAIVGGELFAAAMIGFACVGINEFFRMVRDARPVRGRRLRGRRRAGRRRLLRQPVPDDDRAPGERPGDLRRRRAAAGWRGSRVSIALTVFGIVWIGLPCRRGAPARAPEHGASLLVDVLVGDVRRRHGRVARRQALRPPRLAPACRSTRPSRASRSGSSRGTSASGSPHSTRTGRPGSTRW